MKIRVFSIVLTVIMFLTQIGGNCLTVSATEESGIGTEIGALTDMDYNVWFENLRDEYHTWFYTNEEEPKLSLNVDNLDGCEYEVEWTVGITDDNGEFLDTIESVDDAYEVTVSGCDLIFKPDELRAALEVNEDENFWCTVRAVVYADETEVASAETGVEIRIPTYTYFFPVEDDLCQLPYWDYGIDKNMGCWVNDVLYPEGADIGTEITNVEVSNDLADEDESPVVTVEPYEDGSGWNLHMERMGHATGTITYKLLDGSGENGTKTFNIWVGTDVYPLDIITGEGTECVLPGESVELTANFRHECFDEENGHFEGSIEGVVFEWGLEDENCETIVEYEVDADNQAIFRVSANEESVMWDVPIYVRAYMPDENGDMIEVAYRSICLYIRNNYYNLMPLEIDSVLAVGDTIEITPCLKLYSKEDGIKNVEEITEGISYRFEWDTNAVEITDAEGKVLSGDVPYGTAPFTVEKLKNWYTEFTLVAELTNDNDEVYEAARRIWCLNEWNYEVGFKDLRGGDFTWIYADDEDNERYELLLDTENIVNRPVTIEWNVGICGDDGIYTCKIEETENTWQKNIQNNGIVLNAAGMENALRESLGLSDEENVDGFLVRAIVYAGSDEVWSTDAWVELRKPVYSLQDESEGDVLPGTTFVYGNALIDCWVENKDYPHGENLQLTLTDISFSDVKPAIEEEAVFMKDISEDGTVSIMANSYGEAIINYVTEHEVLGEKTFSLRKWVASDTYRLAVWSKSGTTCMFPETSLQLECFVVHNYIDDETGEACQETIENYVLDYPSYDSNMVNIDTGKRVVTAGTQYGETFVEVRAQILVGTDDVYECWNGIELNITDSYHRAYITDVITEPGSFITPDVKVMYFTENNQAGVEVKDFRYQIETPSENRELVSLDEACTSINIVEDILTVVDAPENVVLPVAVFLTDEYGNEIRCEDDWIVTVCMHDYKVISTIPSTCKVQGEEISQCSKCQKEKTEKLPLAAHTPIADIAVEATCTTPGKTEGSHCGMCNEPIKVQTIIPVKNHSYQTVTTKATTKKNGSTIQKCSVCGNTANETIIYYPKTIKLAKTSYSYDGKVKKPKVTVKDSKGKTISSKCYTVSYSKNKLVGQATVTIKFKGDYSGTVKKTFTIVPKATNISKLTVKGKGFTVKWKKQTAQVTGYEIQYSTSSKFSSKKTVTVNKNKTTSYTISKLKANKKYYVRIRTYQTVKINGKAKKFYSEWSKAKTVTTKK